MRVPPERAFGAVLRLGVGGVASRCGLPFDRVDELQIAVDALLDHRVAAEPTLALDAAISDRELVLEVGPFVPGADPAGHRVTAGLVERTRILERDGHDWVELAVPLPEGVLARAT